MCDENKEVCVAQGVPKPVKGETSPVHTNVRIEKGSRMVDIAKEAFNTKNFHLAADIYNRIVKDCSAGQDLYLGLADSCVRAGRLKEAIEAYQAAFRLGSVQPSQLSHLVDGLMEIVKDQEDFLPTPRKNKFKSMFECGLCLGVMNDPITIPCGHSYCRSCLVKEQTRKCNKCGIVHYYMEVATLKTNILLSQTIEKWFPNEATAVALKTKGNELFTSGKYMQAVDVYSESYSIVSDDHLVVSNRSHAFAALKQYIEALDDANTAIQLKPDWPKGYYRKGNALMGLNRYEEAVIAYLQCLTLNANITCAKGALTKALHKVLAPLTPDDLTREDLLPWRPSEHPSLASHTGAPSVGPFKQAELVLELRHRLCSSLKGACGTDVTARQKVELHKQNLYEILQDQRDKKISYNEDNQKQRAHSSPVTRSPSPIRLTKSSSDAHLSELAAELTRKRGSNVLSPTHCMLAMKQFKVDNPPVRTDDAPLVNPELVCKDDFECSLCFRLLYEPVTTPCGHVFCRCCLDRVLDHNNVCPLCKHSLAEYLAERRSAITEALSAILTVYFPEFLEERKKTQDDELTELLRMENDQKEIPIFVCTMAYPMVRCPLHIFEPRYRLMMRQVMEAGTRQFGMCITQGEESEFSEYGCILEIRDVQFFPDGRSVVDTIGGNRFRVVSRGSKDGYNTAKVEHVVDKPVRPQDMPELRSLLDEVYSKAKTWWDALSDQPKHQITQAFGPLVENDSNTSMDSQPNGPAWTWWLVAVMPLDPRAQLNILAMTSLKERLLAIKRVLEFIYQRRNSGRTGRPVPHRHR